MDRMDDTTQAEKPIEQVKDKPAVEDTGDVQVEDASPQVPKTQPESIPEVVHKEPAASGAEESGKKDDEKNYPGGERFDPSALPKSEDAKEIRKQVEFYFSDSNLATDKFLYTMVSENQGWADLRSVANFKRMRRFQPYTAVVAALRESTELDVDESGEKVKRKTELKPFTASNTPVTRSVYVKGFAEETKTLQVDLEKYFENFGEIKVVRLRRTDDGKFKGSVFVEFATVEQQADFLKLGETEGTAKPKYEDKELEVMSKKAYLEMKEQQYGGKFPQNKNGGKKPFNAFAKDSNKGRRDGRDSGRGRGGSRGRGGRGGGGRRDDRGRDNDRNAERQERDQESKGEEKSQGEKRSHEEAGSSADGQDGSKKAQKVEEGTTASTGTKPSE